MLFDLRGRGRRRTVRVIYGALAVLMGGGLVLFGVGSFGGTGIVSGISGSNEGGSGGASFSSQIKKYKKLTQQQPTSLGAWEKLITAELHEAGGEAYVTRAGVTQKGKELYSRVGQSWRSYVALNPPKPNPELAQRMVAVFDEEGLNDAAATVGVLQIVVGARPNSTSLYAALAQYAYKAHNTRVGDLAAAKAISLAPVTQRVRLKTELEALKKNPSGVEAATATTNGKTFTVKSAGPGSYTGTVPATTPSPATPTKKK